MSRKLAVIAVSAEMLVEFLKGGVSGLDRSGFVRQVSCDIPGDLEIIHAAWDFASNTVHLTCESESFSPVGAGALPPPYAPMMRTEAIPVQIDKTRIGDAAGYSAKTQALIANLIKESTDQQQ